MEDGGAILGPVLLIDPSLNIIPMKKRREKRLRKGVCSEIPSRFTSGGAEADFASALIARRRRPRAHACCSALKCRGDRRGKQQESYQRK